MATNQSFELLRQKYIRPVPPVRKQPLSKQTAKFIKKPEKPVYEAPKDELAAFGVDDTMTVGEVFKKFGQVIKSNDV